MAQATDDRFDPGYPGGVEDADLLAEFSGRACYQSWSRPNPATAKNEDYIRSTVHEKGHESITAHASVTYYITGVSRALTHELIRHRWLAFSELSQRYVNMAEGHSVVHPGLQDDQLMDLLAGQTVNAMEIYEGVVHYLENKGYSRKEAREAARQFLPQAMETKILVTGNMRAWRNFLRQRWSVHADAEIRELAGLILADLRQIAPNTVADIPEEPYE